MRFRAVAAAAIWLAASGLAAEPARIAPSAADGGGKASDYKQAQFLFRLGYRGLAGDTWEAAGEHTAVGFEGDWRPRGWPFWPTFAMNLSADTENDQLAGSSSRAA